MTRYIRADTNIRSFLYGLGHQYLHTGYNSRIPEDRERAQQYLYRTFGDNIDFDNLTAADQNFVMQVHSMVRQAGLDGHGQFFMRLAQVEFPNPDGLWNPSVLIPGHENYAVSLIDRRPPENHTGPLSSYYGRIAPHEALGVPYGATSNSSVDTTGVMISHFNGWHVVQPIDMAAVPERMREYVAHSVSASQLNNSATGVAFDYDDDGNVSRGEALPNDELVRAMQIIGHSSLDSILTLARSQYREWLVSRRGSLMNQALVEFERKRREHATVSARRFETFRSANMCQDQLIPTLPFVPHGLAASRRWGIEVESGGARGVTAPDKWTRKRDGSLRSAWDGYTEVQDFEPHDEERTETIEWYDCERSDTHVQYAEVWNPETRSYDHTEVENFVDPSACDSCGETTRTVHVTPQTITHRAQNDDCAEFVSPILTSMHSNGLETLVGELAKQPQNDTAGVHVHVESNDLSNEQIALLVYGYDQIERFIESSYQRGRRDYARRQPTDRVLRAARDLKRAKQESGDFNWVRDADRYLTVNVQALRAHGTIEFRAMGPVYNYDHLIRWAMFCREMVNVVANGATYKDFGRIKKWGDLLAIFAKYGKEYTRAAVYEMTGETGFAARLSKENAPMTAAALNADLESLILGLSTVTDTAVRATDTFRSLAVTYANVPNVTAVRTQVQTRLVTATRTLASV